MRLPLSQHTTQYHKDDITASNSVFFVLARTQQVDTEPKGN